MHSQLQSKDPTEKYFCTRGADDVKGQEWRGLVKKNVTVTTWKRRRRKKKVWGSGVFQHVKVDWGFKGDCSRQEHT